MSNVDRHVSASAAILSAALQDCLRDNPTDKLSEIAVLTITLAASLRQLPISDRSAAYGAIVDVVAKHGKVSSTE